MKNNRQLPKRRKLDFEVVKGGGTEMKIVKESDVFVDHYDWYRSSPEGYFVPTEKAPPEAVKAMEYCNKLAKEDIENDCHRL